MKGISGDGGVGEVGAVASGHASARGSTSSKERRAAELLDMVARRRDDGERELHGGAGTAASATAVVSEGDRQGRMDVSTGFGARRGGRPARPRARRQAGGPAVSSRTPASPLCLLWREQAANWPWASTVLGRQVGCQVSSSLLSVFLYLFISVLCFEIVEILFHLGKP